VKLLVGAALALALAACAPDNNRADDDDDTGVFIDGGLVVDASGFNDAIVINEGTDGAVECSGLPVKVRDFKFSHPDFEHFTTDMVTPGIVQATLGADNTPVYAAAGATVCTTSPAKFAEWYHDVPTVNFPLSATINLVESSPGIYVYDSSAFFPADGAGFGNEGQAHNFAFTSEIHTSFKYKGGEVFTFRGDDDLWLFINKKLAIDLGGLHQPASATINLDARAAELGLVPGNNYAMDIFHAERHTTASNFRIETTIDCFIIP
jgi:fibro-slime domain-containing protein